MKRPPWIKWYPTDWRADPRLRMCSLAARGLWVEMLGLMHEADPYGHLVVNGRAPSVEELAVLVGAPLKVVRAALDELDRYGVWSETVGTLYSRRMVRDKARHDADIANGKRGGNPRLKPDDPQYDLPLDNPGVNPGGGAAANPEDKAQRLEARGQIPDDVVFTARDPKREVLEAIGVWDDARWQGHGALVSAWLAAGADLDLDILPTVKAVMATRGSQPPPGNLKYFDRAVMNAHATRTTPAAQGKPNGAQANRPTFADKSARAREAVLREAAARGAGTYDITSEPSSD